MRVFGLQVWPVRSYSPAWYLLAGGVMLALLLGCSDATAPEPVAMRELPSEELFTANMKANGFNYSTTRGPCDPGPRGTVADVNVCFMDLLRALAFTGAAIGTCSAAIGGAPTVTAAIGAGSVCALSVFGAGDAYGRWAERTQVGTWANQSAEEIANRMRQAIFERMVARGLWNENAGCC